MTETCPARLFGGHYDGITVDMHTEHLANGLRLPIPPTREDFEISLPGLTRAEQILTASLAARVETYVFDGTVNEQGEHRFRCASGT